MDGFLYSIYDRVAGSYGEPFFAVKDEIAIRHFNYLMANALMVAQDCDLFKVASIDLLNGHVDSPAAPVFVCRYEVKSNG